MQAVPNLTEDFGAVFTECTHPGTLCYDLNQYPTEHTLDYLHQPLHPFLEM